MAKIKRGKSNYVYKTKGKGFEKHKNKKWVIRRKRRQEKIKNISKSIKKREIKLKFVN